MAHFIVENCTGCTICALKCPTDAIIGTKGELHVIIPRLCLDCRICGRWCPVTAVEDEVGALVPRIKAKAIPKAQVDPDMCTGCDLCAAVCPFDVISMELVDPEGPDVMSNRIAVVLTKKCTGCQLCEDVCIKHAIWVDAGTLDSPSHFQLDHRVHPAEAPASTE